MCKDYKMSCLACRHLLFLVLQVEFFPQSFVCIFSFVNNLCFKNTTFSCCFIFVYINKARLTFNLKPNQQKLETWVVDSALYFRYNRPQHAPAWQSKQQSCVLICSNFELPVIFRKLGLQYLNNFIISLLQTPTHTHTHTPCWTVALDTPPGSCERADEKTVVVHVTQWYSTAALWEVFHSNMNSCDLL